MAYTDSDEIKSDFKDITFESTDNVTADDVSQFIVEADALIDSYLGQTYVVPVLVGAGKSLLKLLSRSLVTARIKRLMEVKQEQNADANVNVIGVLLSPSAVMKILENLRDKKQSLEGATLLSSSSGFYSKNVACGIEPVIKKDEKQW